MAAYDWEKEFKAWKWNVPEHFNMGYDCCDKWADDPKTANKTCLMWESEKGDTRKFTFAEMKAASNRFGNVLRKLGVKKGDRFLIRLPNVPEFQMAVLGGFKIGAVPIPSSMMFKDHEIEYRLNDSDAVAVLTSPEAVGEVDKIIANCPSVKNVIIVGKTKGDEVDLEKEMKAASDKLTIEKTKSTDIAFFCYTSGTTGNPKGAVHEHRWGMGNDPNALFWQAYQKDDIFAHTGDLNWIFPFGNGFIYAWRHGITTLVYQGRFDPAKWYSLMAKYKVTNLASVPTCYRMFLTVKDAEKTYDLKALRHCISAGEPLNPEVVVEWKRRFGIDILDGIGMTEIMVYLSNQKGMPIKPGSCGRPQPGHICAVVDDKGTPQPVGQEGNLAVKRDDPSLFREYWKKPEKTTECFVGEWFLSGDTLRIDEDGYFWFAGRGDDLIKASGYRISPFEVESAVNSHPAVLESAAVASPDPIRGTIVKSFVVLREGQKPSDKLVEDIQDHVKKVSAAYKYPREIEFVSSLPKTQSGKTKRKVLREQEKDRKQPKKL